MQGFQSIWKYKIYVLLINYFYINCTHVNIVSILNSNYINLTIKKDLTLGWRHLRRTTEDTRRHVGWGTRGGRDMAWTRLGHREAPFGHDGDNRRVDEGRKKLFCNFIFPTPATRSREYDFLPYPRLQSRIRLNSLTRNSQSWIDK